MKRKLYWGLGTLAVLLIGMTLGLLIRPTDTDPQNVYIDVDPAKEVIDPMRHDISKKKPPTAKPGYKIVQHGDHYHEVPIDAPDVWQEKPTPIAQDAPTVYDGPLTYHAELLETNPVKALRLQAEERGHWSAKWIPPFPPDDVEAAAIAHDTYLITYYESIDDTTHPLCQKALRRSEVHAMESKKLHRKWYDMMDRVAALPFGDRTKSEEYQQMMWLRARSQDLGRLKWTRFPAASVKDPERMASYTLLSK